MATGRIFDEQARRRYCLLISRGTRPATAAEQMGFTWATIKRHIKTDPEFAELYEASSRLVNEEVEAVLYEKAVEDGDLGAIKMWLVNRAPEQWQDQRSIVQHTGPGGGPIQIVQNTVLAFREVLTTTDTREAMLELVDDLPALGAGDDEG